MKLTNNQLRQIIKEELDNIMMEMEGESVDIFSDEYKKKIKDTAKKESRFGIGKWDFNIYDEKNIVPTWVKQGQWQDIMENNFPEVLEYFGVNVVGTGTEYQDKLIKYYRYLADALGIQKG